MSWFSDRVGIHLGNVGAPVGMALGSLVGMPTVGAALGGAVGGMGHGDGLGSSLMQGATGAIGAGGLSKIPGLGSIPGIGSVSDFLGGNGGMNALGLLQGANAAYLGNKSTGLANNALNTQRDLFNEAAPLRQAGIAGMLNPGAGVAPKIAGIQAQNHNPFATPMPATPSVAPAAGSWLTNRNGPAGRQKPMDLAGGPA